MMSRVRTRPMIVVTLLLWSSGCQIPWDQLLKVDHTTIDPAPPAVVTQPQFRLLIIEETADRPTLPAEQLGIFTSTTLRDYLDKHCTTLADGSHGYRIVDQDDVANLPAEFQATAKLKRDATPWLYCTDGTRGLSTPLPADVDELLAKIRPYAESDAR
jgi:hypothetical protein